MDEFYNIVLLVRQFIFISLYIYPYYLWLFKRNFTKLSIEIIDSDKKKRPKYNQNIKIHEKCESHSNTDFIVINGKWCACVWGPFQELTIHLSNRKKKKHTTKKNKHHSFDVIFMTVFFFDRNHEIIKNQLGSSSLKIQSKRMDFVICLFGNNKQTKNQV